MRSKKSKTKLAKKVETKVFGRKAAEGPKVKTAAKSAKGSFRRTVATVKSATQKVSAIAKKAQAATIEKSASKGKTGLAAKNLEISKSPKASARGVVVASKSAEVNVSGGANSSAPNTYLPTPTPAMLRSFRKAAKRSRDLAKKMQRKGSRAQFLAKPIKNGKKYTLDLRIHSPGTLGYFSTGGVDPGPALVRLAKVKGIDCIGLTDYYNASYVDLVREVAVQSGITIIPGVDLRCKVGACDEVYLVCLFPEQFTGADIFRVLDELRVPKEAYGRRDYCLETDLADVVQTVERNGGIIIPSRLDKTPYRQLVIPMLVERFGLRAFDLVHPENPEFFQDRWPDGGFTFFSFSNANALAQIGSRVAEVKLTNPGFEGVKEIAQRKQA